MNIIITMAGEGSRFQKIGFTVPKHMIEVQGKSLFSWSLSSFENFFEHNFIFITRKSHNTLSFIEQECRSLGLRNYSCLELAAPTSGQAESALLAKGLVPRTSDDLIIYNIDTFVEPACLQPSMIRGEGWVPVFSASGDRWSFTKFNEQGLVREIAEKRRISEYATVGLYYFSSFDLFESCYRTYDFGSYPERYVAPLYEVVLRDGKSRVYSDIIPAAAVHVLGTPEDVRQFCPSFAPPA